MRDLGGAVREVAMTFVSIRTLATRLREFEAMLVAGRRSWLVSP